MSTYNQDICTVCRGSLTGQLLYTAECSHILHYNCIASLLRRGSPFCPTCNARWMNAHSHFPAPPPTYSTFSYGASPYNRPFVCNFSDNGSSFNDDEPLPTLTPSSSSSSKHPSSSQQGDQGMTVKALPEYPALSKSDSSAFFAVLVGIRAPALAPEASSGPGARAPIDLVAVLDVSGSMSSYNKINLVKQAVNFVVDNLGPTDRLSVITFSTSAVRVTPLKRMTEAGKLDTIRGVASTFASGSTNIIAGLQMAVKVLEQRRQKNPVTSVILLSDGEDTDNRDFYSCLNHLPHSIRSNALDTAQKPAQADVIPVHTFGFGADHDPKALHAIADGSAGTFSFIGAIEVIQDAFARCMGGLLSVVAQEVEIQVYTGSSDVKIQSIPSGRYRHTIDSFASQHGVIYVGDIYAEEEKQFLVYVSVPQAVAAISSEEPSTLTTKLLEAKCSYKDSLSNVKFMTETTRVEIHRPSAEELTEDDKRVCLDVDRVKNLVSTAEVFARAQALADAGEREKGKSLLQQQQNMVMQSAAFGAGDVPTVMLFGQTNTIKESMATKEGYAAGGRAFALSAVNSHMYQRASTQAVQHSFGSSGYGGSIDTAPPAFGCPAPSGGLFGASGGPAPTAHLFGASGGPAPSDNVQGGADSSGFGYQTSFMQEMVRKSKQNRQSTNPKQP